MIILSLLLSFFITSPTFALEKLFYTLRDTSNWALEDKNKTLTNLNTYKKSIDILVPQSYILASDGTVKGSVNQDFLDSAKQHKVKFMPLVTNPCDSRAAVHKFLTNKAAEHRAIQLLLHECRKNHYYGLQIDFECLDVRDRNALTQFYKKLSQALHHEGFSISIAITPRLSNTPGTTQFLHTKYQRWTGAFDYKKLGHLSNFVTLMTYDQHIGFSTPGPMASYTWDEAAIKYALKFIPAKKISFGIPTYSGLWKTAQHHGSSISKGFQIDYTTAMNLLKKNYAQLHWDDIQKIHYAFYERDELNEYIFLENASSFRAKLSLAKKYKLRGISVYRMGIEDPDIWKYLSPSFTPPTRTIISAVK